MHSEKPSDEQPKASVMLTLREIADACVLWVKMNRQGVLKNGACDFELRAHVEDSKTYARITEQ